MILLRAAIFSLLCICFAAVTGNEDSPNPLSERIANVERHLAAGNAAGMLEAIEASFDSAEKELPDVQTYKARALITLGMVDEGEKILQGVHVKFADYVNATLVLGKLKLGQKDYDSAEDYLTKVLGIDTDNTLALNLFSKLVLARDSNHELARTLLERALRIDSSDTSTLFDLGITLLYGDDHERAKTMFDRAGKLSDDINHKLIGKVYLHYGHLDWALEQFMEAVALGQRRGSPDAEALLYVANTREAAGQHAQALRDYSALIDVQPYNAIALVQKALLLLGTGGRNHAALTACGLHQREALSLLQLALQIDPSIQKAREALDFCRKEIDEVSGWRRIVSQLKAGSTATAPAGAGEGLDTSVPTAGVSTDGTRGSLSPLASVPGVAVARLLCASKRVMQHLRKLLGTVLTPLNWISHAMASWGGWGGRTPVQGKVPARPPPPPSKEETTHAMQENWRRREESLPKVPRLSVASAEELFREYMSKNRPVVVTNFQNAWADRSDFSSSSLVSKFGDSVVRVSVSDSGRFDGPENGTLWGLSSTEDVLVRPPQTSMLLADFMHLTQREDMRETFYLEYLALHQYLGENMTGMMPLPAFVADAGLEHLVTNVWIGSRPTTSPLHYDDYENFLVQIHGVKEVILFPPADLPNLYYVGRAKGRLDYAYPSNFTRDARSVDRRAFVFGSSVNVDRPDLARHPLYARASPIRATLYPGDALYLPAYWHHEVQSLPAMPRHPRRSNRAAPAAAGEEGEGDAALNVAVNFWFANVTDPLGEVDSQR